MFSLRFVLVPPRGYKYYFYWKKSVQHRWIKLFGGKSGEVLWVQVLQVIPDAISFAFPKLSKILHNLLALVHWLLFGLYVLHCLLSCLSFYLFGYALHSCCLVSVSHIFVSFVSENVSTAGCYCYWQFQMLRFLNLSGQVFFGGKLACGVDCPTIV